MRSLRSAAVAAAGVCVSAVAVVPAAVSGGGTAVTGSVAATAAASLADVVQIHPDVLHVGHVSAKPPTTAQCEANYKIACYGAKQMQRAYDLPALFKKGVKGKGQTIVIVDSFGSPTVKHDLNVYDRAYKLPAPPSLKVIQPAGKVHWKKNDTDEGWAGETTLDVEAAHTIAPKARILLVETPVSEEEGTTGFPQIVKAEKYVIKHHLGGVISQSFSATEQTFPTAQSLLKLRGAYIKAAKHGVT